VCALAVVWESAFVCPKYVQGMSGGWVFVIILVVCGLVYLGLGVCYNAIKNEKGLNLLPQAGFWRAYYTLCVEGAVFFWQCISFLCCCPRRVDKDYQGVL
jgi:hypothetical protein